MKAYKTLKQFALKIFCFSSLAISLTACGGFGIGCKQHNEDQLNLLADLQFSIDGVDKTDKFVDRALLFSLRTKDYNWTNKSFYNLEEQLSLTLDFARLRKIFDDLEVKPEKLEGTEIEVGREMGIEMQYGGSTSSSGVLKITAFQQQLVIPESNSVPDQNSRSRGPDPSGYLIEFEITGSAGGKEFKIVGRAYMAKRLNYSFETGDCS